MWMTSAIPKSSRYWRMLMHWDVSLKSALKEGLCLIVAFFLGLVLEDKSTLNLKFYHNLLLDKLRVSTD